MCEHRVRFCVHWLRKSAAVNFFVNAQLCIWQEQVVRNIINSCYQNNIIITAVMEIC